MTLSRRVQKYFWDINPTKARPKSHPDYYIKRVLEFGNKDAISWLKSVFGRKKIISVARKSQLPKKIKNFLPYV